MDEKSTTEITRAIYIVLAMAVLCIFCGWWIKERTLTTDIMKECRLTCGNFSGYVEEVTVTKCVCSQEKTKIIESPWVLPKK